MSSTQARSETAIETPRARTADMKLEVVVIPVSDVDRAKRFYGGLGLEARRRLRRRRRLARDPVHAARLRRARSSSARTSPRRRPAPPRDCT